MILRLETGRHFHRLDLAPEPSGTPHHDSDRPHCTMVGSQGSQAPTATLLGGV